MTWVGSHRRRPNPPVAWFQLFEAPIRHLRVQDIDRPSKSCRPQGLLFFLLARNEAAARSALPLRLAGTLGDRQCGGTRTPES